MASRQVGPWKLMVKDRAWTAVERFIASDGSRLGWVWRSVDEIEGSIAIPDKLTAPWLSAAVISAGADGPVLWSVYSPGVLFGDLLDSASGETISVGAAAAVALATARGLEQLPEAIAREQLPCVLPEAISIGFDGSVSLVPWPDAWPNASGGRHRTARGEWLTENLWRRIDLLPGWRTWWPSLVLLDAIDGTHRPVSPQTSKRLPAVLRELTRRALSREPTTRPALGELIEVLTPLASTQELENVVGLHFASEPREQQYERAIAEGRDPEPLPSALVASVSNAATDEAFGVLADWLLGEGHPRGELAAIQLKLEKGAQHELMRAEAELLQRHRSLLPFTLRERLQSWKPIWKAGWLVGLELKAVPEPETLTEILTHPTLRFLRRIRVKPEGGGSKVLSDVLSQLELPALRQVELDGGVHIHGVRLRQAKPHLNVESSKSTRGFPARRRPEASVPHARVGVGDREPAPGLPPLNRLIDWLSGDD